MTGKASAARGNLPAEPTTFIGRRRQLQEIKAALTGARLVTLVGPGGVGKTRLALSAATDLRRGIPDGVWLVELAGLRDPELVRQACKEFPGKVAVGIDARGGKVAVEGWAEASTLGAIELAKKFEGAGVAAIIYTDIDRDGVLAGINWEATIALADAVSIPVIASGGLASIADIVRMTMPDAQKLEGAISGRALYDGRLDGKEALKLIRAARKAA